MATARPGGALSLRMSRIVHITSRPPGGHVGGRHPPEGTLHLDWPSAALNSRLALYGSYRSARGSHLRPPSAGGRRSGHRADGSSEVACVANTPVGRVRDMPFSAPQSRPPRPVFAYRILNRVASIDAPSGREWGLLAKIFYLSVRRERSKSHAELLYTGRRRNLAPCLIRWVWRAPGQHDPGRRNRERCRAPLSSAPR